MDSFHVWLRPAGDFCQVRVEGHENTRWLLNELGRGFIFRTFEPMVQAAGSPDCSFMIPYNPPLSRSRLRSLIAAFSQVIVVDEPESLRRQGA